MRAVAYCRVSTDKADQLNSLETQKEFFEAFMRKESHELVNIYADEGITGTSKKNRKQFLQLMADAEKGKFEIVYVKDISRLARNTVDFLQSVRRLKALNIETQFITNNVPVSGDSELMLTIFAAMAQEESANMSKRIRFGKNQNAAKGRVPNLVYGYDKTNGDYFNLSINGTEAAVVQRIFHMYLEEGYGANKIAILLNKDGIRTKRGARFTQNAVIRILTNAIYTGKIINKKQEIKDFLTGERKENAETDWLVVDKPELRIISEEDFARVAETLKARYGAFKMNRERHSNAYPFSTLIKCEHCGYSFRRVQHTYVNTYTRWVCSGRNANGAGACPNKTVIDEGELLEQIRGYLAGVLQDRQSMSKHIVREFQRSYKDKDGAEADAKAIAAELAKLKTKRSRELDLYTDEIIDKQELNERTGAITKRIAALERDLTLANGNLTKADALAEHIQRLFSTIERALDSDVLTNAVLKKIIAKITVNDEGVINIHLKPLGDMGLETAIIFSDNRT